MGVSRLGVRYLLDAPITDMQRCKLNKELAVRCFMTDHEEGPSHPSCAAGIARAYALRQVGFGRLRRRRSRLAQVPRSAVLCKSHSQASLPPLRVHRQGAFLSPRRCTRRAVSLLSSFARLKDRSHNHHRFPIFSSLHRTEEASLGGRRTQLRTETSGQCATLRPDFLTSPPAMGQRARVSGRVGGTGARELRRRGLLRPYELRSTRRRRIEHSGQYGTDLRFGGGRRGAEVPPARPAGPPRPTRLHRKDPRRHPRQDRLPP